MPAKKPPEKQGRKNVFFFLDLRTSKWAKHRGVERLAKVLNLENTCGYITFVDTGVPDIGCENYDLNVHLLKPKSRKERKSSIIMSNDNYNIPNKDINVRFTLYFNFLV